MTDEWMNKFTALFYWYSALYFRYSVTVITSGEGYVIVSVCRRTSDYQQDYYKSNRPISLKLGVVIGPTTRKNVLTFGDDPFPHTDSGSHSHFSRHSGIH